MFDSKMPYVSVFLTAGRQSVKSEKHREPNS